ncbi:hypothetical protein AB1Y20_015101 [Prymnesium parvum]|uniref:Uncharacterized protein n=1 Tax=Prymnesium parvum TaxID=97485 RepID=A0AB34JZQ0_PRYPA|mmetsp:Transcript_48088/g.119064  ORF Transcript_48088/g.119064 Transcript_48088/m.119064 type:complete len:127 (+) Transcript_48088:15-395(+)
MLRALTPLVATAQRAAGWVAGPTRWASTQKRKWGEKKWWQPVLPALAKLMLPKEKGKGRGLKRQQKRMQQVMAMAARRREGVRRNKMIRAARWEETKRKVQDIYTQYAKILQRDAAKGVPPPQLPP